jgi:hypothetical protein
LFQLFATDVIDTGGNLTAAVVDTGGNLPLVLLTPVSTTPDLPVAKFAVSVIDTSGAP